MYKTILLIFILTRAALCFGQDAPTLAKPVQFAIVSISSGYGGGPDNDVWVYYDNGEKENLKDKLNLPPQTNSLQKNADIARGYEFKTLAYLHNKGFELLSISYDKTSGHNKFYFEHR